MTNRSNFLKVKPEAAYERTLFFRMMGGRVKGTWLPPGPCGSGRALHGLLERPAFEGKSSSPRDVGNDWGPCSTWRFMGLHS